MKISREGVLHVAQLARLDLSPEQVELFQKQLNDILDYMERLNAVDTTGVEPTSHAISIFNAFREDRVEPSPPREEMMANAPDKTEDSFRVPIVIE